MKITIYLYALLLVVTFQNTYSMNPNKTLCEAACQGDLELIKVLIKNGDDINKQSTYSGRNALHAAASTGHLATVEWLLDNGATINAYSRTGQTPFFYAVFGNQEKVIELLINRGANVNAQDIASNTLLQCIALMHYKLPDLKIIQHLIDSGIDINNQNTTDGSTALHDAILFGKYTFVLLLIQNGANTTIKNNKNQTVLDVAITKNDDRIKSSLEQHTRISKEAQENPTRSSLKQAIEHGYYGIVKNLLETYTVQTAKEDIQLAKLMWQNSQNPIYKKIGKLLIAYYIPLNFLMKQIGTRLTQANLPAEIVELIAAFANSYLQ
jgi:ankyrin repeat protein